MTNHPSELVEVPPLRQLIDGVWSTPPIDLGIDLENPNTGRVISRQLGSSDDDALAAAQAAWQVHQSGEWSNTPAAGRAAVLEAIADALDQEALRIAALESLGTGAVIGTTSMLAVIINGGAFRLAAAQLREGLLARTLPGPTGSDAEILRLPWGPALCLVPWNAPAPMAAHKVANALAAGAPTILKPSEWAPYGTQALAEVIDRVLRGHDLPTGLFQLVQGGSHVGGQLVRDPRIRAVSFTGGLGGGRAIATACAQDFTASQLELGGNNPIVVLDDADVEQAANGIVDLMTQLNGQWCRALGRLVLAEPIAAEVMELVLKKLATITLGDSLSPETTMGPIVHSAHLEHLHQRIAALQSKGGQVHTSTTLPDGPGNFLAPTLITGVASADAREEIFGPVATVHTVTSDQQAIEIANDTPFGLEAYVFSGNADRGMAVARRIHAGGVKVNGSTMLSLNLFAPRPAWGLSGQGDEGTIETLLFFTNTRVVGVENLSAADLAAFAAGN